KGARLAEPRLQVGPRKERVDECEPAAGVGDFGAARVQDASDHHAALPVLSTRPSGSAGYPASASSRHQASGSTWSPSYRPTRMSPPKAPKLVGASVTAQGESSLPRLTSRWSRSPFGAKTSTNPLPGRAASSSLPGPCLANVTKSLPPMLWIPKGANPAGTV